jgi:hypothetical protein
VRAGPGAVRPSLPLLVALVCAPAAAASDVEVTFAADFTQVRTAASGNLTAGESGSLRALIDFDRNGQVSEAEVARATTDFRSTIQGYVGKAMSNMTLDGKAPATSQMTHLAFHGAPGPVRGGAPIGFEVNMTFAFATAPGSTHTWRVVGTPAPGGTMHVRLHAPEGWHAAAPAFPSAQVEAGGATLLFDMPTDKTPVEVELATARPASAFGLVHALAALGLAGAFALRRR